MGNQVEQDNAGKRFDSSLAAQGVDYVITSARISGEERARELGALLETEGLITGYKISPEPPPYAHVPVSIYVLDFIEQDRHCAEQRLIAVYEERHGDLPDPFIQYQSTRTW